MAAVLLLILLLGPLAAQASPGGLDQSGCHVCHTNCNAYNLKDEEYHCHQPKAQTIIGPVLNAQPIEEVRSKDIEQIVSGAVFISIIVLAAALAIRRSRKPLLRR